MLFTLNDRLILLYSMTQNKMSIREVKSGAESAVITRPDSRVRDVNISMDEQWLFIQSTLNMYVYSIQDGSLHETCSLIAKLKYLYVWSNIENGGFLSVS